MKNIRKLSVLVITVAHPPKAATARLKIDGMNDLGQTLDMTVVCHPKGNP